jgi:hypothetical protein
MEQVLPSFSAKWDLSLLVSPCGSAFVQSLFFGGKGGPLIVL